jgi:hypothetical protein
MSETKGTCSTISWRASRLIFSPILRIARDEVSPFVQLLCDRGQAPELAVRPQFTAAGKLVPGG